MDAYLLTQIGGETSNSVEYDLFFLRLFHVETIYASERAGKDAITISTHLDNLAGCLGL